MPTVDERGSMHYRVDVAFDVEASSPAMAIRKLLNALDRTVGKDYTEASSYMNGVDPVTYLEAPVDLSIALDDPRLIAGAVMGVADVREANYDGVAT